MGNFNRGNKRSGGGGFDRGGSGRKSFGGQRPGGFGGRPTMYKAVCSECGDSCEVPFKPTGSKPVFCSFCFDKQDGGGRDRDNRGGGRSGGFDGGRERHRDRDREMYNVVCDKCGKNCQVPFQPKSDKPVFCEDCFGKGGNSRKEGGSNRDSGELMSQIKMLNEKMDKLITILTPNTPAKETKITVKEPVKAKKEKAKTAKKKTVAKKKKSNSKQ